MSSLEIVFLVICAVFAVAIAVWLVLDAFEADKERREFLNNQEDS